MWLPLKIMCYRSSITIYLSISVHCILYVACGVFLTWCAPHLTPPPSLCLPCLAGHLTLLSLRWCCHGNSSVTGPGWVWGMSCGVMAKFLQQRQREGETGRDDASKAKQRWLMRGWKWIWLRRRGGGRTGIVSLPPCFRACCYCGVLLTPNLPVMRVAVVSLVAYTVGYRIVYSLVQLSSWIIPKLSKYTCL